MHSNLFLPRFFIHSSLTLVPSVDVSPFISAVVFIYLLLVSLTACLFLYLFVCLPSSFALNTTCDAKGFRRVYVASDPDYAYGTDANTTFFVRVFNFTTPITIQISFAQSPPINWVLFFVIFAACFIVLLVVAGLLWMIKLRIEVYRRNQRRIDEIEHATGTTQGPTPLSVEPCSNYKSGIFTLAVRLPTGGRATTPNGTSGL
ncbi:unnamed protein product, partial [Nippostrongylus brasiliensis]|uniref:Attractin GBD domain-containing protein n=1 Tax=Nippostrongylus brasiliensis TaxID=27835 RepID=A0A0N4XP66_NIPBR